MHLDAMDIVVGEQNMVIREQQARLERKDIIIRGLQALLERNKEEQQEALEHEKAQQAFLELHCKEAQDLLEHKDPQAFVIISGDRDFSGLGQLLRSFGSCAFPPFFLSPLFLSSHSHATPPSHARQMRGLLPRGRRHAGAGRQLQSHQEPASGQRGQGSRAGGAPPGRIGLALTHPRGRTRQEVPLSLVTSHCFTIPPPPLYSFSCAARSVNRSSSSASANVLHVLEMMDTWVSTNKDEGPTAGDLTKTLGSRAWKAMFESTMVGGVRSPPPPLCVTVNQRLRKNWQLHLVERKVVERERQGKKPQHVEFFKLSKDGEETLREWLPHFLVMHPRTFPSHIHHTTTDHPPLQASRQSGTRCGDA